MALALSEPDVAKILRYEPLIPAMEKALSAFSAGCVIQPMRNLLVIEKGSDFWASCQRWPRMEWAPVCFFPTLLKNVTYGDTFADDWKP